MGLTYIRIPILRPHASRYTANMFEFHERCIPSVKLTSAHLYGNVYMRVRVAHVLADSSDFGILGEQSLQKKQFAALLADEPPSKM